MNRSKYIPNDFLETLFENRNKRYGAYKLRRLEDRFVITGLILSIAALAVALLMPAIISFFMQETVVMQEGFLEKTPLPETQMVRVYLPPPPPVHEKAVVKISKDSLPEKKEIKKEVKKEPEKSSTDSTSKDTSNRGGNVGTEGAGNNGMTRDVILPSFPGGKEAMTQFLRSNVRYPAIEEKQRITGEVIVAVKIHEDGSVSDARVVKSLTRNCDAEALRVVQSMRFIPGRDWKTGKPISLIMTVPIVFSLKMK